MSVGSTTSIAVRQPRAPSNQQLLCLLLAIITALQTHHPCHPPQNSSPASAPLGSSAGASVQTRGGGQPLGLRRCRKVHHGRPEESRQRCESQTSPSSPSPAHAWRRRLNEQHLTDTFRPVIRPLRGLARVSGDAGRGHRVHMRRHTRPCRATSTPRPGTARLSRAIEVSWPPRPSPSRCSRAAGPRAPAPTRTHSPSRPPRRGTPPPPSLEPSALLCASQVAASLHPSCWPRQAARGWRRLPVGLAAEGVEGRAQTARRGWGAVSCAPAGAVGVGGGRRRGLGQLA